MFSVSCAGIPWVGGVHDLPPLALWLCLSFLTWTQPTWLLGPKGSRSASCILVASWAGSATLRDFLDLLNLLVPHCLRGISHTTGSSPIFIIIMNHYHDFSSDSYHPLGNSDSSFLTPNPYVALFFFQAVFLLSSNCNFLFLHQLLIISLYRVESSHMKNFIIKSSLHFLLPSDVLSLLFEPLWSWTNKTLSLYYLRDSDCTGACS